MFLFLSLISTQVGTNQNHQHYLLALPLIYLTSTDPITLVFGLEILTALTTILVLRHIQNSFLVIDAKKILSLLIVNMCGFVFLSVVLIWWLFIISNSFTMYVQKNLTTPLLCYFIIKYATLGIATLKAAVYEGVPFIVLITLTKSFAVLLV